MAAKKPGCYIYPITSRLRTGVYNPYIDNFIESNNGQFEFLNKNYPSGKGIFDLVKYLGKTDVVFFNWIENLPEKKGGIAQTAFLVLLLLLKRLLNIKVVWTLHNKYSHSVEKLALKQFIFKLMLRKSDLILTHSTEGIDFAEQICPGVSQRMVYFQHPVPPQATFDNVEKNKRYDIMIWGSLSPYKGIDTFLEYLHQNNLMMRFRILIAGKALSEEFYQRILELKNEKVEIINDFLDKEELRRFMLESSVVLFTYSSDSVLSSGALMDTLANNVRVIGPHKGAFADLNNMGIIKTFKDWEELVYKLENLETFSNDQQETQKRKQFLLDHTWEKFAIMISTEFHRREWL